MPETEVTIRNAIPVTTPARTLLDLAAVVSRRELERAMDEAAYLRLDLSGLRPRRRRAGRRCGLAAPLVSTKIEGDTVALTWPDQRLIVETDGWRAHGTRQAFERDPRRDASLTAAGWRVLRVTWRRLQYEPRAVATQLKRVLDA